MALLKFHVHRENNRTPEERREAQEFGKLGEQMTAKYLTDKGYIILELKSRTYDNILQPEAAVDHKKRQALIRLANEYVKSHNRKENVRFDIVTIVSKEGAAEIKHLKNAYNVMSF